VDGNGGLREVCVRLGSKGQQLLRLVCLSHAGAGAAPFFELASRMPAEVGVLGLRLPGRESRIAEAGYEDLAVLLRDLREAICRDGDLPVVLLGDCSGAIVMFELAHALLSTACRPVHLFCLSQEAPQHWEAGSGLHELSRVELVTWLAETGGTDTELLECEEFVDIIEGAVRADLRLLDGYVCPARPPLPLPITALCGRNDHEAALELALDWGAQTADRFSLHVLSGEHFLVESASDELRDSIVGELLPVLGALGAERWQLQ